MPLTTLTAVHDVVLPFLATALGGTLGSDLTEDSEESSSDLIVTHSMEMARLLFDQGVPFIVTTLRDHEPDGFGRRLSWELLLEMSMSMQNQSEATPEAVAAADRELCDQVTDLINGDAGYRALRALALLSASIKALPEDQKTANQINPHVLSFMTIKS